MSPSLFPIGLVVAGGVAYHIGQKAAASGQMWRVLVIAYGLAFALSVLLFFVQSPAGRQSLPRPAEVGAALVIGIAAMAIEVGFFWAYRAGWSLGTTSLIVTVGVTTLLTVIGLLLLGEKWTVVRVAGIVLAVSGACCLAKG